MKEERKQWKVAKIKRPQRMETGGRLSAADGRDLPAYVFPKVNKLPLQKCVIGI
jgi:hypothetical protein